MSPQEDRAVQVYQRLLDSIGEAIEQKDKETYVSFFFIPHKIETFEKTFEIRSVEELGRYFDRLVDRLSSLHVRELVRTCTLAEFVDLSTIKGCHDTRLIDENLRIRESYTALSTLRCIEGAWLVSASQYAEAHPSIPTLITR